MIGLFDCSLLKEYAMYDKVIYPINSLLIDNMNKNSYTSDGDYLEKVIKNDIILKCKDTEKSYLFTFTSLKDNNNEIPNLGEISWFYENYNDIDLFKKLGGINKNLVNRGVNKNNIKTREFYQGGRFILTSDYQELIDE